MSPASAASGLPRDEVTDPDSRIPLDKEVALQVLASLAARHAPAGYTATALTVQNGTGFLVTTVSIQLVPLVAAEVGWQWAFTGLAIGPAIGAAFTFLAPAGTAAGEAPSRRA